MHFQVQPINTFYYLGDATSEASIVYADPTVIPFYKGCPVNHSNSFETTVRMISDGFKIKSSKVVLGGPIVVQCNITEGLQRGCNGTP